MVGGRVGQEHGAPDLLELDGGFTFVHEFFVDADSFELELDGGGFGGGHFDEDLAGFVANQTEEGGFFGELAVDDALGVEPLDVDGAGEGGFVVHGEITGVLVTGSGLV